MSAKTLANAKHDMKTIQNVDELLKEIPKDHKNNAANAFNKIFSGNGIYNEKDEELEIQMLSKMSNIEWLIYPFKKTVIYLCKKIFGCKKSSEKQD